MTKTPPVGTPQKRGTGWFVPSGAVGYHVEQVEGRWRCTCPSFRWRKGSVAKTLGDLVEGQR